MELTGRQKLEKIKRKNLGNTKLVKAIDKLINDIETNDAQNLLTIRKNNADCVHSDGFYFFDINIHRTLILIEFDNDEATIEWVGDHQEYEKTFGNNKDTITKWLRKQGLIN